MKYKPKPLKTGWHYKRGDVYLVDLNPSRGCEQGGVRPAVVVQKRQRKSFFTGFDRRTAYNKDQKENDADPLHHSQPLFERPVDGYMRVAQTY